MITNQKRKMKADAAKCEIDAILEKMEFGDLPDVDTASHAMNNEDYTIEYLKVSAYEAVTSLALGEVMAVDEELHLFGTQEAIKLSNMMWNTLRILAERRIAEDSPCNENEGGKTPQSFFNNPGMPYNLLKDGRYPEDAEIYRILSLPRSYSYYLFKPSKVVPGCCGDGAGELPRVFVLLGGNYVRAIYSDLPVKCAVLRDRVPDRLACDEE